MLVPRTFEEAYDYIVSLNVDRIEPSLTNIKALVEILGNPQDANQSILIGGTNGKTSTAHMVSALLSTFGLQTGTYTSPHLVSITERFRINGKPISPEAFVRHTQLIIPFINAVNEGITLDLDEAQFALPNRDLATANLDEELAVTIPSKDISTPTKQTPADATQTADSSQHPTTNDDQISDADDNHQSVEGGKGNSTGESANVVSYFEAVTAMAFNIFADKPVEMSVVEVGMGGAWDATNVCSNWLSIITPISFDHPRLGDTITKIATEKVGIIKPNSVVVSAQQPDEAMDVIRKRCSELSAKLYVEGEDFELLGRTFALGGQVIDIAGIFGEYNELFLPLHGRHQAYNATLAMIALELFMGKLQLTKNYYSPEEINEDIDDYLTDLGVENLDEYHENIDRERLEDDSNPYLDDLDEEEEPSNIGIKAMDKGAMASYLASLDDVVEEDPHMYEPVHIPRELLEEAFRNMGSPGRLEVFYQEDLPMVLVDGAHNVAGMQALTSSLKEEFAFDRHFFVLSILDDKDISTMVRTLQPIADHIVLSPVKTSRQADISELEHLLYAMEIPYSVAESAEEALDMAYGLCDDDSFEKEAIIVTGSLYLVGEILPLLESWEQD